MKAPDKVYIDDLAVVNDCATKISLKQLPYFSEYIRKDTLLEWLKKEYETISWYYEKMKHITRSVGDNSSSGKAEAYKKVIEKIELL